MFFPSGNAEEFCDHVFRTFDMDKNGYIDFKVSLLDSSLHPSSMHRHINNYGVQVYLGEQNLLKKRPVLFSQH